ncbi:alternative ribosome rescue aminoacyl-tRNA hydrolase ArfB [Fimbriiglobus ruber]|uniref:Prokaryotic-type class I peptide chain release factors domain-containing protein n=1 Tax=Fimbriiglobus ruber TaxID=1908690 RepID=A0A225DXM0_9BACT|nr:alternative ribosome rescue aminoacyl-tRNA hydrolase ArfB [Fimbriiglobus ruber]OWK44324.1 hypothetical protein FRUB_02256 [Fimbriiglobus ruber]
MLPVTDTIAIPDDELDWSYARSSGPGGQNVNKVASKAVLRWAYGASRSVPLDVKMRLRTAHPARVTVDGDFLVVSQKYRDQERNRADCLEKLAAMIRAAAVAPVPRKVTKPTKGSKRRRVADKRHQSTRKEQRRSPRDE